MTGRLPLTVTPGRHPFEIGAFAGAAAAGLWGLFIPDGTSRAIADGIASGFVTLYYGQLAFFGLAALASLCVPVQNLRMRLERCCCWGVGYSAICYAVAAFFSTGLSGGTAAMFVGWVSIPACTWRIVQISRDLARIREARAANQYADPSPLGCPDQVRRPGGQQ